MINNNKLPIHVAIIPDGNRRWAKAHKLPVFEGHRRGYDVANKITKYAHKMGIPILTYWAFSTENWLRVKEEVGYLMMLFEKGIGHHLKEALVDNVRIIHIGRKDRIPSRLREKIEDAEKKTNHFDKKYLVIALDYGGRDEIERAIEKVKSAKLKVQSYNNYNLNQFLDTKDLPQQEPDLIIRTGGEKRTSGFMLWQSEYSEYEFVNKLFPDFTTDDFDKIIDNFQERKRRFGK